MDRLCLDRMKWKCRRGLLELDLVLARIVPTLKDEDVPAFSTLLELPDNELWDIVAGRSDDYGPRLQRVVANLRAA
jgi:antitoxin CptB